jgi:hypothetical protein
MSVKASVSLSEQQDAFARELVRQGRYASLSAASSCCGRKPKRRSRVAGVDPRNNMRRLRLRRA